MENKIIKINKNDINMIDAYAKKFDELYIELSNLNEVQLSQVIYLGGQSIRQHRKSKNATCWKMCPRWNN